jgi:hypothetical protein
MAVTSTELRVKAALLLLHGAVSEECSPLGKTALLFLGIGYLRFQTFGSHHAFLGTLVK